MDCKKVNKVFRVVGIKGSGNFCELGKEVPKLAQQFIARKDEIKNHCNTEIALFEPKRDAGHKTGHYYVGLIVNETLREVPFGMEYIEKAQDYVSTRGNINNLDSLHNHLLKWAEGQGYKRDLESYIIETYHPMVNGEEVEIYLPIYN
ncbi:GyrI-like domain-containing protein [Halobacillus sp. Marseille-Q1614]|uniref:GyrI-like domain-containing protein n=1 Tax=Halobacillus sp. Marseille-Q1614 TaxID=2709134 RepID=UPI00156DDE64|nr:GyrI-like domain-containing protein [Halobacillus sp. Marseille-Q1614]